MLGVLAGSFEVIVRFDCDVFAISFPVRGVGVGLLVRNFFLVEFV
jgi:hypothetical protein